MIQVLFSTYCFYYTCMKPPSPYTRKNYLKWFCKLDFQIIYFHMVHCSVNESLCSAAQHCMYLYILKVFGFNFFPGSQQVHVTEYFHFTLIYYMATIVHALWLAAEQALFSCNDRALWNFFSAQRLFWVRVSKTTCAWVKTAEKMDKVQLFFQ